MSEPHRLGTKRLELRPSDWDDLDALHRLWTDPDVRRWLWDDAAIPRERAAQVIEESLGSFDAHGFGVWTLRERAAGARGLAGFVGLRFVEGSDEIELLYGLAPGVWGRGYASEASRAVLDHAFGELGVERVAGRVDTPNADSVRVLERLGMEPEGERPVDGRPTLHFAISRGRWSGA